jgi:CheY-like chemotaxis protein
MDDEEGVLEATTELLQELGYRVEAVKEGGDVITLYREALQSGDPFDGVVMDLIVPGGMGGKDAVQELLKIDPNVKAVVTSGYSTDPVVANYKEYGFYGALSKPFRIKELSTLMRKILLDAGLSS